MLKTKLSFAKAICLSFSVAIYQVTVTGYKIEQKYVCILFFFNPEKYMEMLLLNFINSVKDSLFPHLNWRRD